MTKNDCNNPLPECIENFADIKAKLGVLLEKTNDIQSIIRGNGREGLIIRKDRLEQAHNRLTWLSRILLGAILLLVVNQVWVKVFPPPLINTNVQGITDRKSTR